MPSIGTTLRAARRRLGRSLADAAASTRIRESYLAALEEEDFGVLGGDVYARGFLRSYARYLELDPEPLLDTYREEHERPRDPTGLPPGAALDPMLPDPDRTRPPQPLVVGAVAALLALVVAVLVLGGDDDAADVATGPEPAVDADDPVERAEALRSEAMAAPTAVPTTSAGASAGPAPSEGAAVAGTPMVGPLEVALTVVRGPVRVRVVQGQPPVDATLQQGDQRTVTGDAVAVEVSDAAALEVSVNGAPLPALGAAGEAVVVTCTVGAVACEVAVA